MATKGFTLVELLAVVLIVAIMMGIGLPQYRKAVDKARVTEAEGMLRMIYDSSERLAGDFGYASFIDLHEAKPLISLERFDMFDADHLPAQCEIDGAKLLCSRFSYWANRQAADGNFYVVAKLLTGRHKGTYILLRRDNQSLYCQPKAGASTDFCDVLGLDISGTNFSI